MTHSQAQTSMPPYMQVGDKVILFDGVCKLCNAWSQFIIRYDKACVVKLASVQSKEGQAILQHFNYPITHFDTMLFVNGNQAFEKSTAFLNIVTLLPAPLRYLRFFRILPRFFRDFLYDRIALNRYWLFGKYQSCMLPSPDHKQRYL